MNADNLCKRLVEERRLSVVRWLVDPSITGSPEILKTELGLDPIRADFVSFLQFDNRVAHIEFQTTPKSDPPMPIRMLDYKARLIRAYGCEVIQVVVFLQESGSPKVFEDRYQDGSTVHEYKVVRMWEQDPEVLMRDPALWPLVPLCRTGDPVGLVQRVAEGIEGLGSERERAETAVFTYMLGGLRLDRDILKRLLREEVMRESVTYRELVAESEARGLDKGIRLMVTRMIEAGFDIEQVATLSGLTPEQVRQVQAEMS